MNLEKKDNFFLEKKKQNYGVYSLRMLPREPRITEVWGRWGTEQEKSIGSSGKKISFHNVIKLASPLFGRR